MTVTIHQGDALEVLRTMPAQSVHMCVTSPPYYGLRDYEVPPTDWPAMHVSIMPELPAIDVPAMSCALGLEPSMYAFVAHVVSILREVGRVLRDDGTLWLNVGDSYAGKGGQSPQMGPLFKGRARQRENVCLSLRGGAEGVKSKDLMGVPWVLAFALRADGWFLRQDIIWHKPNPMPESVTDRCTKSHEYLFLLSKSGRYYFDAEAIAEPIAASSVARLSQPNIDNQAGSMRVPGKTNGAMKAVGGEDGLRNKRSVWTVATQPFRDAHFATFPPALIEPCILAGCPIGGTVLDPFGGSGTTGLVADRLQRSALLIELNPGYAEMSRRRIDGDIPPLLREVAT